jgi:lysozyme family protein
MADLKTILPITLAFEGGWADNPKDPGGATMKGVTIGTYRQYHPMATKMELRNISDTDLLHIYDTGYFKPIEGESLSQGVGLVAFDYGVNSGTSRAKKALASTITLSGAARVRAISDGRLSFLHGLSTWAYFGPGWGRRVGECEAQGIKWESATPAEAQATIQAATTQIKKRTVAHAVVAASSVTSTVPVAVTPKTVTSTSTAIVPVPAPTFPVAGEFAIIGVLVMVALVFGLFAFHNSQRVAGLKA